MKDKMEMLWDSAVKYSKRKGFFIYYSTDVDIVINFEWDKRMGGISKFLKHAESNNVKSIVISVKRFEDEDIDCSEIDCKKYYNKIAELDLMYILNDVGYKFHEEAGWFTELNSYSLADFFDESDDKKVLPLTREINEKSVERLAKDMIQYFDNETPNSYGKDLDNNIKNFWLYKGINLEFPVEADIKAKIEKVNARARKIMDEEQISEERHRLVKLIPSISSHFISGNHYNPTKEQLSSYLSDNNIKIQNKSNLTFIYRQLIKELKAQSKKL
ncbi:MAG: hypothetical protein QXZ44_01220 [Ferroplasma sp.]